MFARTSDRGEPAKINFCRLRTDAVENSPNPCSGGFSLDRTFGGNCIALSMKRSSWPYWIRLAEFWYQHDGKKDGAARSLTIFCRFCEKSRYILSQAEFMAPTTSGLEHYSKPERAESATVWRGWGWAWGWRGVSHFGFRAGPVLRSLAIEIQACQRVCASPK